MVMVVILVVVVVVVIVVVACINLIDGDVDDVCKSKEGKVLTHSYTSTHPHTHTPTHPHILSGQGVRRDKKSTPPQYFLICSIYGVNHAMKPNPNMRESIATTATKVKNTVQSRIG